MTLCSRSLSFLRGNAGGATTSTTLGGIGIVVTAFIRYGWLPWKKRRNRSRTKDASASLPQANTVSANMMRSGNAFPCLLIKNWHATYVMHTVFEMITFHLLLHLIALASFFGITISYTVNSDCRSEVNDWIIEAIFLFDRAAKVLESAHRRSPSNIKNILQACLGKSAKEADFKTVHG